MQIKVIIPARKNSKGLPGKNLKHLAGKPLIDYTINTALKLFKPEDIILTSDSEDILERGKLTGINTILRPKELATDSSQIIDTILHAANSCSSKQGNNIHSILLLQPTFPVRDYSELKEAINTFKKNKFQSLVSTNKIKEHPCECIRIDKKYPEKWENIFKEMPSYKNRGEKVVKNHTIEKLVRFLINNSIKDLLKKNH